jgi:hypothetical protein
VQQFEEFRRKQKCWKNLVETISRFNNEKIEMS